MCYGKSNFWEEVDISNVQKPSVSNAINTQFLFTINLCLESQKKILPNAKYTNMAVICMVIPIENTFKDCSIPWPVSSICLSIAESKENGRTSIHNR
jgi:hypothetical protein